MGGGVGDGVAMGVGLGVAGTGVPVTPGVRLGEGVGEVPNMVGPGKDGVGVDAPGLGVVPIATVVAVGRPPAVVGLVNVAS